MSAVTITPRHASSRSSALHEWMEADHAIRHAILVPAGLVSLAAMFVLGYALLFLS